MSSVDITPYLDSIEAQASAGRCARKITDKAISQMIDSGYIRSLVPKQFGGLEITPQDFFKIQIAIAERDMSSAWVGGIIAIHAYQLALMDERAQIDVYGDNPDACISSSYNPVGGRAEMVDDGIMLSGRWGWSSGSDHCSWVLLGAIIAGEGYRTLLVPRSDYQIEDTWFSMGLQGTGSNDIVIEQPVFVPHYRTHKQMDGFNCLHNQTNPMYSIPWAQMFIRVVSTPAIGAVKHALKLFIDNANGSSTDPTKMVTDPDILGRLAKVQNHVDEVETILFRNFDIMMQRVTEGGSLTFQERAQFRYQAGILIDRMIEAIDLLFAVAGGRSVYIGADIQNIWHDIHIARAHVANNPVGFARNLGNIMLGGENQDVFL